MKMKKLLASALAAAMVVSSMVGTLVTSAAETVGTITAGTVNAIVGQTDTINVGIDIDLPDGVVAPHILVSVALEGYELTGVTLGAVIKAEGSNEGNVTIGDEYGENGTNLEAGKILLESPIDEYKAPTVTKIPLTATFVDADDVDTDAGTYEIIVKAEDMTNTDEAEIIIDAYNGSLVVAEAHVCDMQTKYDETGHWTECACGEKTDAVAHELGEAAEAEDGKWYQSCDCGYSVEVDAPVTGPVEDLNIKFTGSIVVSDTLGVSYTVSGVDSYADFEVVVTKNAYSTVDYNLTSSEDFVTKAQATYYKGSYYATVYGFALTDLCLDVTTQVKCYDAESNLVAVSITDTTTIKDLAVALYNSVTVKETKAVLTDLLNMGTEAQKYFAGRFANSDLAKVAEIDYPNYNFDQSYATAEIPELTLGAGQTVNNGATISGMGSILQSPAIAYVLKPTATPSALSAEVSFYDAYAKSTKTITALAGEMTLYKGSYYYNFASLPLYASNAIITINLYDGETLLGTHTYSVEQFASENLSDANMGDLLTTIAKFGASARTYFKIG